MAVTITNKYNLPEQLVEAVKYDNHRVMGDISVTQFIDSPQIRFLKRKHDVKEDVTDRIWALLGSAVHHILERGNIKNTYLKKLIAAKNILEEINDNKNDADAIEGIVRVQRIINKYFQEQLNDRFIIERTLNIESNGMEISGTLDVYDREKKILYDYKTCSVFSYIYPESRKKWQAQQNMYAYMLDENGYKVEEAYIVAIFKDFSYSKLQQDKDYPPSPICLIPIKLVDKKIMRSYIEGKVKLHQQANDGNIAPCSENERWARPTKWAIRAKNRKRAVKVFDEEKLAKRWMEENGDKYEGAHIEKRDGESIRCNRFCPVRDICPQRREMMMSDLK